MLVTCQRFGDLFLFGLVWQYSSVQTKYNKGRFKAKIQQTKMLVTSQRFSDWFLFGLVWPYSSNQKNIMKVGSKPRLLTCISNITLSLPSLYFSESKRELNFCNGYLSLLYFWLLRLCWAYLAKLWTGKLGMFMT